MLRQAPGRRDEHGEWIPGIETIEPVRLATTPLAAGDLATMRAVLPEGSRPRDARVFWLRAGAQPLRVGTAATDGDRIAYGGDAYRALRIEDWGEYRMVIAVREEGAGGDPQAASSQ